MPRQAIQPTKVVPYMFLRKLNSEHGECVLYHNVFLYELLKTLPNKSIEVIGLTAQGMATNIVYLLMYFHPQKSIASLY